jgi:glyoxylase-like metal-dependent hydrolase (beta-lactamase superfamily II)
MNLLVKLSYLFYLLIFVSFSSNAVKIDNAHFEINKLNENVYVIGQDYGSNKINFGLVIGKNDVSLITSMMKEYAPTVEKLVRTITQKPIKYVFNIDSDQFQHDANEYFADRGATIIAHNNIRKTNAFTQITFDKEMSIDLGNESLTLFHTSAHTKDNMIVYLKNSNVLFMGDAFRNDWLMYSGPNGSTAHIQGLNFAIQLSDKDTKFVPSNRSTVPFSDLEGLKKARNIYQNFVNHVKELQSKGMEQAEITKSEELDEIINNLERYNDWKEYTKYHITELMENG